MLSGEYTAVMSVQPLHRTRSSLGSSFDNEFGAIDPAMYEVIVLISIFYFVFLFCNALVEKYLYWCNEKTWMR